MAYSSIDPDTFAKIAHFSDGGDIVARMLQALYTGSVNMQGIVPAARVAFSVNPSNNDTLGIGGATITFKSALAAQTASTQVKIGANAAATLATLINFINGVTDANVVVGSTDLGINLFADAPTATVLRIRAASTRGGSLLAGTVASTALTASVSGGASAWSAANLNVSGQAPSKQLMSTGQVAITAAMITNGSFQIELPFTPVNVVFNVTASTGVHRAITDAITISGNAINVALAGGVSPAIQANDLFRFVAVG